MNRFIIKFGSILTVASLLICLPISLPAQEELPECTDTALKAATLRQLFGGARQPQMDGQELLDWTTAPVSGVSEDLAANTTTTKFTPEMSNCVTRTVYLVWITVGS